MSKERKIRKLEEVYHGKKLGLWISIVTAILSLLLTLPSWIYITNHSVLQSLLQTSKEGIYNAYPAFLVLQFIKDAGFHSMGLFAMICLLLVCAGTYLNISFLVRVLINKPQKNGNLSFYSSAQAAILLEAMALIGYIAFVITGNCKLGTTVLMISPVVIVVLILNTISLIGIKTIEAKERVRYHEHGFIGEIRRNWVLFLMLVPAFVYLMINNYLPMLGAYYAFTSFNFRDGLWASPFVGMNNFKFLVSADLFRLTRNTILYNLVFIGLGNILQIFFAVMVSQVASKWFKKTSQTLLFMPYFVSFVILKVLIYNIFEYDMGLINTIIASLGGEKIDFYNTPSYWPYLITGFYIWKNIGYGMVVYLATIMGIDSEFYDAARVDGANIFQQIRYITLPQLKPTFIILLLYALGSIMKGQFELFYQMIGNNGVLYNVTDIFDTYVYRITTTQPLSIGLGTAAGLYQSLFGFVIIVITNILVKRKNPEYALF